MDLRGWEFFSKTGNGVSGANVYIYEGSLTHPNPGVAITSTTTDTEGKWVVTGLTNTPKDVKIEYLGSIKWYKGMTQHSVTSLFENNEDAGQSRNLLRNGGFEVNIPAGTANMTGGTVDGVNGYWVAGVSASSGTVAKENGASNVMADSLQSLKVVYTHVGGGYGFVHQILDAQHAVVARNKVVTFSANVKATVGSGCYTTIVDTGIAQSSRSATTGSFVNYVVQKTISATATSVTCQVVFDVSGTYYLDNFIAVISSFAAVYGTLDRDANSIRSRDIQDGAIDDTNIGNRTVNDTTVPGSSTGTLTTLLSGIVNRIKTATGAAGWTDAPVKSLLQLQNEKMPYAGGEFTGAVSFTAGGATAKKVDSFGNGGRYYMEQGDADGAPVGVIDTITASGKRYVRVWDFFGGQIISFRVDAPDITNGEDVLIGAYKAWHSGNDKGLIPAGTIVMRADSTVPSGWAANTSFQNRFPVGAGGTYGIATTGGVSSHTHAVDAHSHAIPDHDHTPGAHTHAFGSHTHGVGAHTHGIGLHTHPMQNHTHSIDDHRHSMGGHTHAQTGPTGTNSASIQVQSGTGPTIAEDPHDHPLGGNTGAPSLADTGTSAKVVGGAALSVTGAPSNNDTNVGSASDTASANGVTDAASASSGAPSADNTGMKTGFSTSTTAPNTGSTSHVPPYIAVYFIQRL